MRIAFVVTRPIKEGEQLLYSYSDSDAKLLKIVKCSCNSEACRGWLF